MITVFLKRNPENDESTRHDVPALLPFLRHELGTFPHGARITDLASGLDVTPAAIVDIPKLAMLPGPFEINLHAGAPAVAAAIPYLVMMAASALLSMIFAPDPPSATQRNVRQESPNNGLSERMNQVRVNGRIPDIYGTVRSTPDLLQKPYFIFEDHVEKEIAYLCIGRGSYAVSDIRDDSTLAAEIPGMAVEVYGPVTSPNSGHAPQIRVGSPINTRLLNTTRVNAVNGQELRASDAGGVTYRPVQFEWPNILRCLDRDIDLSEMFLVGDKLVVSNAQQTEEVYSSTEEASFSTEGQMSLLEISGDQRSNWEVGQHLTIRNGIALWTGTTGGDSDLSYSSNADFSGTYDIFGVSYSSASGLTTLDLGNAAATNGAWGLLGNYTARGSPNLWRLSGVVLFDLSGTYSINTVVSDRITLVDAVAVNPDWQVLADDYGGVSDEMLPRLYTSGDRWVGPITLQTVKPITRAIVNFVALNGLYTDDGKQQFRRNIEVRVEATPTDAYGEATGATQIFDGTVVGSAVSRSSRALTMTLDLAASSTHWKFQARRLTLSNGDFEGSVVDEVKWRDLYGASIVAAREFGDVTTVQAITNATDGALAIKERKLNMLVTRKLPRRVTGSQFSTELFATNNIADILSAICLDPRIGNRDSSEVDFDNFYQVAQQIREYFGVDVAQFNYTIDSDNLSFEETFAMMASAVYCEGYRRGRVLRLSFEQATEDSAMLFNHRNKVPGSETRTLSFGNADGLDGVEYQWINPADDSVTTIYLPEDRSAVNPKRIESVGVRIIEQATIHAWREWNKLRYQAETTEFEALPVANLLTLRERILCADNTRSGSQDGEVRAIDGLYIELSQPFEWEAGPYMIFLQNSQGEVEMIPVFDGGGSWFARLAHAPRAPLVAEGNAATKYIIGAGMSPRQARPFLITEKGQPNDDGTIPITAINYDARYYQNDRVGV